jgi:hypothetical protein
MCPPLEKLSNDRMDISLWYGMVAPAATPTALLQRLNCELVKSWRWPTSVGLPEFR